MTDVTVTRNAERTRFEARVDGAEAGVITYEIADGIIDLQHTIVEDEFEGQGVGSALARESFEAIKADGDLRIRPTCSFLSRWVERHPEYADLLA